MPRRDEVTRRGAIEAFRREQDLPGLVRLKHTAAIHVRSSTAGVCPCCGHHSAKLDDEWDDLDLLLDLPGKRRFLRSLPEGTRGSAYLDHQVPSDVGLFDEIAAEADETYQIRLKVASHAIAMVFDTRTTTLLATGGARSTKTQHGCVWFHRQWVIRGGWGKRFLLLGPKVDQAFILYEKWIKGEGDDNPAICPPELALSVPSATARDPHFTMLDGSLIKLAHTQGDGGNLGGRRYEAIQWTESSHTNNEGNYAQARGRITSSQGQMWLDAVPKKASWLRKSIIDVAELQDAEARDAARKGESKPPRTRKQHFSSQSNPWMSAEEAAQFRADLAATDERLAMREVDGLWVGDENELFSDVFDASKHTYDFESFEGTLPYLGLFDITSQASLRWFVEPHDWIVAVDVNANPHSALVGKIGVKKGEDARNPHNWVGVLVAFLQVWRDPSGEARGDMRAADSDEAARLLRDWRGGLFKGAGVVMDATATYRKTTAGGSSNMRRGFVPKQDYEKHGFEVRGPDRWPTVGKSGRRNFMNPDRADSATLLRRLFREDRALINRVHGSRLVRAIRDQLTEPDGITPIKITNTNQDRYIGSAIDCFRYWAWPFFSADPSDTGGSAFVAHA